MTLSIPERAIIAAIVGYIVEEMQERPIPKSVVIDEIVSYIVAEAFNMFIPKSVQDVHSIQRKVLLLYKFVRETDERTIEDIMPTFRRAYGYTVDEDELLRKFHNGELEPPHDRAKFTDYRKLMMFLEYREKWRDLDSFLVTLPLGLPEFSDKVEMLRELLEENCGSLKPIFEALLEKFESVVSQLPPVKFEKYVGREEMDANVLEVLEYLRSIVLCTKPLLHGVTKYELIEHLREPSEDTGREFLKRLNEDIRRVKKRFWSGLGSHTFLERLHEIIKSI